MNKNFYNSNSSCFNQFQPPQYPVIHQPPQETSAEMLQARENLMEAIQVFLKKAKSIEGYTRIATFQLIHDLQLLDEILPKQAEEKGINKQEEKIVAELLAEEQDDDDDYDEESIILPKQAEEKGINISKSRSPTKLHLPG
ncbi:hypothetical protein Tco_1480556 [Tanacetum coccineum]